MSLRISLVFFFFYIACHLSAQQYNFRPVTAGGGLPGSECHFIRQDSKGYIWISTDVGLVKYNGFSFKTFTKANGLTDNTVFETSENANGKTFYSSGNSELGYIENDSAYTLPITDTLAKRLNSGRRFIYTVGDYDQSSYIIATQNGFFLTDKKKSDRIEYLPPPDSVNFWVRIINRKAYGSYYPDSYIRVSDKYNYYRLCIESDGKKKFIEIPIANGGFSGMSVFKPLLLADGRLLIGFWDAVWIFSQDGSYEKINLPAQLLSVYQDPDQGIWLGLLHDGMLYYPGGNIKNEPQHFLAEFSPTGTCMDTEGGIWVCTLTNGILYCPSLDVLLYNEKNLSSKLYALNYIPPYVVTNGMNNTIYLFSDKNHYHEKTNASFEDTKGTYAYLRQDEKIIAVGSNGAYLLDTLYNVIKIIRDDSLHLTTSMYNVAAGKNKTWGIRFNDLLEIRDDTFFIDKKLPSRGRDVVVDGSGVIYVGTNNGLYLRDGKLLSPVKELPCKINRLKCDKDGNVWACTDSKGIVQLEKGKVIRTYNSSDGLPSDICYDLALDNSNRIWIGTNKGLCCIDLSGKEKTKTYCMSHGLVSNEISKLAIMRNELYVSTPKGLCVVDINRIHTDKVPPPVYIRQVLESNRTVGKENHFTYDENNFTFILEAISYQNPSGILYLYRLNGLDTAWKSSNTGEITFNNLDDGNYKLEAIAINSDGTKSKIPATYIFTITPPFWKTIWFFILEFLFLCSAVYGIILWRTRIIRKRESEKTSLNKMIAEYQMSAIRAKMNPHFIFNAINSIQNYILDNNTQYAYDYLAKFSKLIRQVLVNSEHNLITLQTELEMLAIYIELEQRRFSNKFEYEIINEEKISLDEIKIPTLLIQPFVENAIWHGIMGLPKNRTGKLSIRIFPEKNELHIEIKDNGIGRKESTRKKNGNGHQSMGISLSKKRMEILKAIGHEKIIIEIVDLHDEQDIASGTLVKIILFLTN